MVKGRAAAESLESSQSIQNLVTFLSACIGLHTCSDDHFTGRSECPTSPPATSHGEASQELFSRACARDVEFHRFLHHSSGGQDAWRDSIGLEGPLGLEHILLWNWFLGH